VYYGDYGAIYSVGVDGTGAQRCFSSPAFYGSTFSCSPVDDRILVTTETVLSVVNSAGVVTIIVPTGVDYHGPPQFSPDAAWVLYESGDSLYKVSVNGGIPTRLVRGYAASFSSDGRTILFLRDGGYRLCLINADGTGEKVVLSSSKPIEGPNLSPDGTKIVFWQ